MILKLCLGIFLIIFILLAITLIKTLLVPNPNKVTEIPTPIDINKANDYGSSLSKLIKIETISSRDDNSREKFFLFHKELENLFPLIHKNCEKMVFNVSPLFKCGGKSNQKPIMLMSHHDVVEAPGN